MEKKEFLTEANYEKGKKKIKSIALIILIVGVVLGLGLIITGAILSHNAKGFNIDLNPEQENTEVLRTESEVQTDINTIKPKINSLNKEIAALEMELWNIQMDEGLSDNYYAKQKTKQEKETELANLNTELKGYQDELRKIQISNSNSNMNGQVDQFENIFNSASDKISKARYTPYYMIGGFIVVASCMISGSIYLITKRREIMAFTAQQVMPVAQEGIEKMAPTVGNAAGTIGKSIAQGITSGIKEGLNSQQPENPATTENKEM